MSDDQDKILRLYSRLSALKQNLSDKSHISETYVQEYHYILLDLEEATDNKLLEFFVSNDHLKPLPSAYVPGQGMKYSKENYCEKNFLLTKLDGLLGYFEIKYVSSGERAIGFRKK